MKQFLFVGLGNPGEPYHRTRHNLGIRLLRAWVESARPSAQSFKPWLPSRFSAQLAQLTFADTTATCLFPLTFMNESGAALHAYIKGRISRFWQRLPLHHVLIIHDELELPLGTIKYKASGSARGHNGVKSIQQTLGTQQIPRLLLGIGPKPAGDVSHFVLEKFSPTEEKIIAEATPGILKQITDFISHPPQYPTDE